MSRSTKSHASRNSKDSQDIRYLIRYVVHHNDAVCPSVVAGGDGPKSFLASCIPLRREEGRGGKRKDDSAHCQAIWLRWGYYGHSFQLLN